MPKPRLNMTLHVNTNTEHTHAFIHTEKDVYGSYFCKLYLYHNKHLYTNP